MARISQRVSIATSYSREDTVRQIVARSQLGEADAAVVYTTDITDKVAGQFVQVPLPEELQVVANYPVAVANGKNRAGGEAFVAFVESPTAQSILARWGFLPLQPQPQLQPSAATHRVVS
jgi:molybdate transport system substrate-binding protein